MPPARKVAGPESAVNASAPEADFVGAAAPLLSSTQREMIEICADTVQQLGLPRSVGQIYGVIYASPRPLAFADVVAYLGISNGSASQGLRFLRELGAVHTVAETESRRELFTPETELRRLLGGVLKHRFREPLEAGAARIKDIEARLGAEDDPHRAFLEQRLGSLRIWHSKALNFLPLLQAFLGRGGAARK